MPELAPPIATLLVADDDPAVRQSLERTLTREGYTVVLAPDGQAALERLQEGGVDLVLSDLKMPGLTGLELLREAKAVAPDVDVILLTAFGTVEEAVRAMKDGATDFLTKPFQRAQLIKVVRQALERRDLIAQNRALQKRLDDLLRQGNMIGTSPAFRRLMTLVQQVADSSATVLSRARAAPARSWWRAPSTIARAARNGPFVAVNCAALPETLLESELFGYEKGAFTGAAGRKEGRFELADGGTLFLDEIGDLSPVTQPKLLRVLQEGEFERVGGTKTIRVDVRIVAATNQDLATLVRDKRFREDLFYRLNVITIQVPPLRERPEDVPVLAQHFLRVYAAKNNRQLDGFSDEALGCLEAYSWPGNVRELENVVERAVVLARGARVEAADLPDAVRERPVMLDARRAARVRRRRRRGGGARGGVPDPRRHPAGRRRGAAPRGDAAAQPRQQDAHRQDARHRPQDGLPQAQAGRGRGGRAVSARAFEALRYEVAEGVATVTLNRPEKLNALNTVMLDELLAVLDLADADDDVRVLIVTGAGRAFCAGADLSGGGKTFDRVTRGRGEAPGEHRDGGGRVTLRIFDMKKPLIAAINGPAVGFGVDHDAADGHPHRVDRGADRLRVRAPRRGARGGQHLVPAPPGGPEPGRGVGLHRPRVSRRGSARGPAREPGGPAGSAPAGGPRARARDRAEHLRDLGGARAADDVAAAGRRSPDGGAPPGLARHGLDGPLGRRLRGRDVVPREAPPALHAAAQHGHAALLSLVARAPLRALSRPRR